MKKAVWEVKERSHSDIVDQLLVNRDIDLSQKDKFLKPSLKDLSDPNLLDGVTKASARIKEAVKNNEKIAIYGDYDVDGVTATAILWEAISKIGGQVMPYIPDRFTEGYGISSDGVRKLVSEGYKLIISVDAGVSAFEQISLAKELDADFIVTDHHSLPEIIPPAYAIVHTTKLSGAGVAYKLSSTLVSDPALDLVALGTIADVVPLLGENRVLAKFGVEELRRTTRPGLLAIYEEARVDRSRVGTYEVGFIIDPRLNAQGRLEHALDSLRILLTKNSARAYALAKHLGDTNRERIIRTATMLDHAYKTIGDGTKEKLWVVSSPDYEQGIIGLIAGRLADSLNHPIIAIAEGKELSKGSARSIDGFDVTKAIRSCADILISHGGHPAAAGFTVETKNLSELKKRLQDFANKNLKEDALIPKIEIDMQVSPSQISMNLAKQIQTLAPFGPGNENPLFIARHLEVGAMRLLSENKHLRIDLGGIECIGFGLGPRAAEIRPDMEIDAVFHIEENVWQGQSRLQLKLKDFRVS
jgi:single-stranded-DNA-specific exonuclease